MAKQEAQSGRGFAGMDETKQREIASKGGTASHERGTGHEFTPEEAREAGRKGGEAVSESSADEESIADEEGSEDEESVEDEEGSEDEPGSENEPGGGNERGGQQGGSPAQHAEAGRQSHKNR